jgi:hypothetical protein
MMAASWDENKRAKMLQLKSYILVIAVMYCIASLCAASPSNATLPVSSNNTVPLENLTLANETLTNLANQTVTNLTNNLTQTLTAINQTATNQARLNEEARKNASEEISRTLTAINQTATNQARLNEEARKNVTESLGQRNIIIQQAVRDLPTDLTVLVGIIVIAVIAAPVLYDLHKRPNQQEKTGFYRALMTFGVIIVVGIVVFYLITLINFNILTENPNVGALIDVLKNLSTILGTAMATIVAFYFGTRVARGREGG